VAQTHWHALLRDVKDSKSPVAPLGWDLPGAQVDDAFGVNLNLRLETDLLRLFPARQEAGLINRKAALTSFLARLKRGTPTSEEGEVDFCYRTDPACLDDLLDYVESDRSRPGLAAKLQAASLEKVGSQLGLSVTGSATCSVGNLFDVCGAGLHLRLGLLPLSIGSRDLPILDKGVTEGGTDSARVATELVRRSPPDWLAVALYFFGRAEGRVVAYNRLLQNGMGAGEPEVDPARLGYDLSAGAAVRIGPLEVAYSQLWRSHEMADPPLAADPHHNVGQWVLTFFY